MDVTKEKSIKKISQYLKKKNIKINILVNNAAIDSKVKKNQNMTNSGQFEKTSANEWTRHLNVGLMGSMLCSKIFGEIMSKNQTNVNLLCFKSTDHSTFEHMKWRYFYLLTAMAGIFSGISSKVLSWM